MPSDREFAATLDLLLAYGAGLLTLINPCVLPVLPIILGSALREERLGPVALCAGMSTAFVIVGVGVAADLPDDERAEEPEDEKRDVQTQLRGSPDRLPCAPERPPHDHEAPAGCDHAGDRDPVDQYGVVVAESESAWFDMPPVDAVDMA